MNIDIEGLIPEQIDIKVWNEMYTAYLTDWRYVLDQHLNWYLEADYIYIYMNNKLFDTIERRIALREWDTLHLEYTLYVGE